MIRYRCSHPVWVLGPAAGAILVFLGGCAYSSSETPRPLEPDYERVAQEREAEAAAEQPKAETEGDEAPELLETDPRAPTTSPARSWGE